MQRRETRHEGSVGQGRLALRNLCAGLDRPGARFNSLDAQREACEAYVKSQSHEVWRLIRDRYDDGGFSGGSMDRPALQKLLADVQAGRIDVIVVYKVDRLTRYLEAGSVVRLKRQLDAEAFGSRSASMAVAARPAADC
jgi:site-specific DNA recombinase